MSSSQNPLYPIPKIWIPAVAALVVILLSWLISGDFGTAELAALLTTLGYFVLGYVLPGDRARTRSAPAADEDPRFSREPLQ